KALIFALFLGGLSQAALPTANAQTNVTGGSSRGFATSGTPVQLATNATALFTQLVKDMGASTKFSSGLGINLHGQFAPLLSQELSLFGRTGTNSAWSTGPSHATFFIPAENQEQVGWSYSMYWYHAPKLLRFALFNADNIDLTINWGLPAEDYYQLFRHIDWRDNRLGVSITRKF
ncbi:MAG TPA: hypothetical protein VLZ30_01605, partial [Verrucomicrobiae bacterium]|nr:hypothetical protein [Verrucomicrobiae bacterium]